MLTFNLEFGRGISVSDRVDGPARKLGLVLDEHLLKAQRADTSLADRHGIVAARVHTDAVLEPRDVRRRLTRHPANQLVRLTFFGRGVFQGFGEIRCDHQRLRTF